MGERRSTWPCRYNPIFTALQAPRRRTALVALLARETTVDAETLAREVAGLEGAGADPRTVRLGLEHVDLPALAEADLVTWDAEADAVATADHPAFDDGRLERVLRLEVAGLDDVLAALARERHRATLAVVAAAGAITREALATELARRFDDGNEPDPALVDQIEASLVHVQLPALGAADLLETEADGTVRLADNPALAAVCEVLDGRRPGVLDRFDGFLGGLGEVAPRRSTTASALFDLPGSWTDASHG
ncbi:MAG: hypothetical protein ABEJ31_11495 [Haloarculaceae archaeon]